MGKPIKEAEVFMGDIPLMTDSGTFIINGSERVIISQIVRSSGAYFTNEMDRKSGKNLYKGDLIPGRGTWLQAESDTRNTLYVRLDRQFKFPAHILFMACGLENKEQFRDLFGDTEFINATLAKDPEITSSATALMRIFAKLKPGEPSNHEGRIEFLRGNYFDGKRYDLGRPGRFKLTQKLGIYNRLPGCVLAETLTDENGEVVSDETEVDTNESTEEKMKRIDQLIFQLETDDSNI